MFLWAICFPLIVTGLPLMPHLFFATLRAVIAGTVLLGIALYLKRPMPGSWTTWWQITFIGIGATTFGFIGMFHAAEFINPGLATVIANTQPLLAALLGHFILGERLTFKRQSGLILGFAGILIITIPQLINGKTENYLLGIGYIFLAALGITFSNIMIKKLPKKVDALVAMGWQLVLGGDTVGSFISVDGRLNRGYLVCEVRFQFIGSGAFWNSARLLDVVSHSAGSTPRARQRIQLPRSSVWSNHGRGLLQ